MAQKVILSFCLLFLTLISSCRKVDDSSPNIPPIAKAEASSSVKTGTSVILDGSSSSDANSDSLYFSWQFISKPALSKSVITGFDQEMAKFMPDHEGTYLIRLIVSDGIDKDSDTAQIIAEKGNAYPVAKAGRDVNVDLGNEITLDGSGSHDPDGTTLSYSWSIFEKPSSSNTKLNLNLTVSPSLTIDKAGSYSIVLTVSDGVLNSKDTVLIITNPAVITQIKPNEGTGGTEVTIAGKNFDNTVSGNTILFNSKTATILEASYTILKVTAPKGAGTGKITLTTGGKSITGPVFTYYPVVENWKSDLLPFMMASDGSGNLFVSGYTNHLIYKITTDGISSIFAGLGKPGYRDGKPETAQFNNPSGIAVDDQGNVYVADYGNHCIRKIDPSGVVSTLAGFPQAGYKDGPGDSAQFNNPAGLAIDKSGNLYVTEIGNDRVRKITTGGQVTTVAGSGIEGYSDGKGMSAQFKDPIGISLDLQNNLIIADAGNNRIRKIDAQNVVTTIAGSGNPGFSDGTVTKAQFNSPYGITVDDKGLIYIADMLNSRVRVISGNEVSTYAGNGIVGDKVGIGPEVSFKFPSDVFFDAPDNIIYVIDFGNNKIKKIIPD